MKARKRAMLWSIQLSQIFKFPPNRRLNGSRYRKKKAKGGNFGVRHTRTNREVYLSQLPPNRIFYIPLKRDKIKRLIRLFSSPCMSRGCVIDDVFQPPSYLPHPYHYRHRQSSTSFNPVIQYVIHTSKKAKRMKKTKVEKKGKSRKNCLIRV